MQLEYHPAHAFMPYPPAPVENAEQGPLSGLTFGVKDLFDVAGYPTSAGNPMMLAISGIKRRHATAVQTLLNAGARFVGKTVTDEMAYSLNGINIHFGTPRNGACYERLSGGSSSGSASAVSNALCDIALGTDTGGSVRAPASHCGLYGLRPSHGRISLQGCFALAPDFDTCGFFAREPEPFVRTAQVLLGTDRHPLPERPRVLLASDAFALTIGSAALEQQEAARQVSDQLGGSASIQIGRLGYDALHWAFRKLQAAQAWQQNRRFLERYNPPIEPGAAERFQWGSQLSHNELEQASSLRNQFTQEINHILGDDGVIILPTMPDVAPLCASESTVLENYRYHAVQLLCLASLSGLPQVTIPLIWRDGVPLGISLLGPSDSDLSLVRLAASIAPIQS